MTLQELDDGYRVYSVIFNKILILLMVLGLWAPQKNGSCKHWLLRNVYPMFIYFVILYPWTTFLTQEAYWSIPVFLFINLHLSGIFAYRSARTYWTNNNHLVQFITATFIPYYHGIAKFEQHYNKNMD